MYGILLLTVWKVITKKDVFLQKKESGPKFQAEFFGQALHLI
jgi:hypothetical protein